MFRLFRGEISIRDLISSCLGLGKNDLGERNEADQETKLSCEVEDGTTVITNQYGAVENSIENCTQPQKHGTQTPHRGKDAPDGTVDDDSSSDSDDEVLQHYQSVKRSASSTSLKDKKGHGSPSKESSKSGSSLVDKPDGLPSDGIPSLPSHGSHGSRTSSPMLHHDDEQPGSAHSSPKHAAYENEAYNSEHASPSHSDQTGRVSSPGAEGIRDDEHLFDVSDLQGEAPLISKCGNIEVSFTFSSSTSTMTIIVHAAHDVPARERGGTDSSQVRMLLLPTKKQRHKSKVKTGENPEFEEKFVFTKIKHDQVMGMGVRFRLYGVERMRRERMIGECIIGFGTINLDTTTTQMVILEPRSNLSQGDSNLDVSSLSRSESGSSTQSMQHGGMPELQLGLEYNGTTGRLSAEVIKGSNFRNMAMNRPPDTYVKLTLMSASGQELARSKTSVRRGQPNPLYKETFMFQVAQFQLTEVTLMVSVYNKKSMKKKDMIGWFSMGQNASSEEDQSHWNDMRESRADQVSRWHILLES